MKKIINKESARKISAFIQLVHLEYIDRLIYCFGKYDPNDKRCFSFSKDHSVMPECLICKTNYENKNKNTNTKTNKKT